MPQFSYYALHYTHVLRICVCVCVHEKDLFSHSRPRDLFPFFSPKKQESFLIYSNSLSAARRRNNSREESQ